MDLSRPSSWPPARGRHPLAALVVACLVVVAGCSNDSQPTMPRPPASVDAAMEALDEVIEIGLGPHPESVCDLHGTPSLCRKLIDNRPLPDGPPTVLGTHIKPSRGTADSFFQGGLVITVCGSYVDGTDYETEIMAWEEADGGVELMYPGWWSGSHFSSGGVIDIEAGTAGAAVGGETGGGPQDSGGPHQQTCPDQAG